MAVVNGDANGDCYDLRSLLCSEERDFLIRSNGDQVKIGELDGMVIGLYFSAHWCGPCRRFTPTLVDVYKELLANDGFEVVFISSDRDEESFKEYFGTMPWLAVPFSDSTIRDHLDDVFKVQGIPHLVILDGKRKLVTENGTSVITDHGVDGFPFTRERLEELAAQEEAARKAQNLASILVSGARDFVISNDGKKVPISELEGNIVGLYFSVNSYPPCQEFTLKLTQVYKELKDRGESFEVVLISLDRDEDSFNEQFQAMPWFALPFNDKACAKLPRYFELKGIPTLVIIGTDGKTLNLDVSELVEEHGTGAYPFTPEKLTELAEVEKRRLESQTLESLLVTNERDFVIGGGGVKVPVSELVGKTVLLYFSAQWCGPCRAFMPKLIQAYHDIKAKGEAFEIVFISSDRDQDSFGKFFSEMPWLALPYGDDTKKTLSRRLKIEGIPTLVAIGPDGKTVTTEARNLLTVHGSNAYPFTEQRSKELEEAEEERAKGWPKEVKHVLHLEHALVLTRRSVYICDGCEQERHGWSFHCEDCDFDLDPKCALEEEEEKKMNANEEHDGHDDDDGPKEGYVCDGETCYKA